MAVFFVIPKKPVTLRDLTVKYLPGNAEKTGPQTSIEKREPVIYDIDKLKGEKEKQEKVVVKKSGALKKARKVLPAKKAPGNIQEEPFNISPVEKARLMEELDNQIVKAKEDLKHDPKDEDARHALSVAEMTKKFADKNFDYSSMEEIVKTETAKSKENKEKALSQ